MKDELRPAGFSINPVNCYMIAEGLLECWEVWLIVSASGCQGGVKNQVVVLCKVSAGKVEAGEVWVLSKDIVCQGEALCGSDG